MTKNKKWVEKAWINEIMRSTPFRVFNVQIDTSPQKAGQIKERKKQPLKFGQSMKKSIRAPYYKTE